MFADDDLLPLSALQHLLYCERQCALIHVERVWVENLLTLQGRQMHGKADAGRPSRRKAKPEVGRNVQVVSRRLGVWGKCDVVEFHASPGIPAAADSSPTDSSTGDTTPFPIEYKRGRPKRNDCDRVQLCAQAMCLEEMLHRPVPVGAIFYGVTRHRLDVAFDPTLRARTESAIARLRELVDTGITPPAEYDKRKCGRCSLIGVCLPDAAGVREGRASRYVARSLASMTSDGTQ